MASRTLMLAVSLMGVHGKIEKMKVTRYTSTDGGCTGSTTITYANACLDSNLKWFVKKTGGATDFKDCKGVAAVQTLPATCVQDPNEGDFKLTWEYVATTRTATIHLQADCSDTAVTSAALATFPLTSTGVCQKGSTKSYKHLCANGKFTEEEYNSADCSGTAANTDVFAACTQWRRNAGIYVKGANEWCTGVGEKVQEHVYTTTDGSCGGSATLTSLNNCLDRESTMANYFLKGTAAETTLTPCKGGNALGTFTPTTCINDPSEPDRKLIWATVTQSSYFTVHAQTDCSDTALSTASLPLPLGCQAGKAKGHHLKCDSGNLVATTYPAKDCTGTPDATVTFADCTLWPTSQQNIYVKGGNSICTGMEANGMPPTTTTSTTTLTATISSTTSSTTTKAGGGGGGGGTGGVTNTGGGNTGGGNTGGGNSASSTTAASGTAAPQIVQGSVDFQVATKAECDAQKTPPAITEYQNMFATKAEVLVQYVKVIVTCVPARLRRLFDNPRRLTVPHKVKVAYTVTVPAGKTAPVIVTKLNAVPASTWTTSIKSSMTAANITITPTGLTTTAPTTPAVSCSTGLEPICENAAVFAPALGGIVLVALLNFL